MSFRTFYPLRGFSVTVSGETLPLRSGIKADIRTGDTALIAAIDAARAASALTLGWWEDSVPVQSVDFTGELDLSGLSNMAQVREDLGVGDLGSLLQYDGANDFARLLAAIAASASYVRLTRPLNWLEADIDFPDNFVFDCRGQTIFKAVNGNMINAGNTVIMLDGKINGDGSNFTGGGVAFPVGKANQKFYGIDIVNMDGPCMEIKDDGEGAAGGTNLLWQGGEFGRTTPSDPAILGPATEGALSGIRRFVGLHGGGGKIMDLRAAKVTTFNSCSALGLDFGDDSAYCTVDEGSRIAIGDTMTVRGLYHTLRGAFSASMSIVVAAGAQHNDIRVQPSNTVTDNSGNTTNRFDVQTVHKPRYGSPWYILNATVDGQTWNAWNVGGNGRLTLGSSGVDAGVDLSTQNGVPLRFGVGAPDDFQILGGAIYSSKDIYPSGVVSLGLAPSGGFDNVVANNFVTASDSSLKYDLGKIDGEEALSFLLAVDPRRFKLKEEVIPARVRRGMRPVKKVEKLRRVDPENDHKWITEDVEVEVLEPFEETVPEYTVTHGRPHTGYFADDLPDGYRSAGWEDWAGHTYDQESDLHGYKPQELIPILHAALVHLVGRVAELEKKKK